MIIILFLERSYGGLTVAQFGAKQAAVCTMMPKGGFRTLTATTDDHPTPLRNAFPICVVRNEPGKHLLLPY